MLMTAGVLLAGGAAWGGVEELYALEDVRIAHLVPTFSIKEQAAKEQARAALVATDGSGKLFEGLKKIESNLESSNGYLVGGKLSLADVWVFASVQALRAGFIDGIPRDGWLDKLPKIKASADKVACEPKVKAYFAKLAGNKIYENYASL